MLAVSGGSKVFHQIDAPTAGMGKGDLWYDINDNNKCYRYDQGWKVTSFTNTFDTIEQITSTSKTDEKIVSIVRASPHYAADLAAKANASDITDLASKAYVASMNQAEITQRDNAISQAVAAEKTRAEAVENAVKAFMDTARPFFDFAAALTIQKPGSDYTMQVSNGKLSLCDGGTPIAYLEDGKFYMTQMTIGIVGGSTGLTDIVSYYDTQSHTGGLSATWRFS